jgi:hypothetical protein
MRIGTVRGNVAAANAVSTASPSVSASSPAVTLRPRRCAYEQEHDEYSEQVFHVNLLKVFRDVI